MKLTVQDIDYVANLARLKLDESEKEYYAAQLSVVFDYIDQLQEVNTDDVPETCQVTGLMDVTRDDVVVKSDETVKQKLIVQFPEREANFLKVKEVFNKK